jgi:hypothetical protein
MTATRKQSKSEAYIHNLALASRMVWQPMRHVVHAFVDNQPCICGRVVIGDFLSREYALASGVEFQIWKCVVSMLVRIRRLISRKLET